ERARTRMSLRIGLLTCVVGLGAAGLSGCTTSGRVMEIDPRDHIPDLPSYANGPLTPYHQKPDLPPPPPPPIHPYRSAHPPANQPRPVKKHETPAPLPALPGAADPPARARPMPTQQQESKKTRGDEPLVVALRAYMQKRPADALEALGRYEKANQDMLLVA